MWNQLPRPGPSYQLPAASYSLLATRYWFCYVSFMSSVLSICAVILAAGESTRMGRDKALLPWPPAPPGVSSNQTFLSAAIRALDPFSDVVIVVAGKNADNLSNIAYGEGAVLVQNP